jgi:hypothetical protein
MEEKNVYLKAQGGENSDLLPREGFEVEVGTRGNNGGVVRAK